VFHERAQQKESPAMNAAPSPANSALFGNEEHLSVSRALGERQARRPIRVNILARYCSLCPWRALTTSDYTNLWRCAVQMRRS
jgi:hypothetical protein